MASALQVTELYAGCFFYPLPAGGGAGGGGAGGFGAGGGALGGGYSGGSISGSGTIISDFEGIIWVEYNGCPPYPVYVYPGSNDIYFYIPIILPGGELIDAPLVITAPGTILIPAGFKVVRKSGDNTAPVPSFKIVDKLGVRDFATVELHSVDPQDVDFIEPFGIADYTDLEIISATKEALSAVDEYAIEEIIDILQQVQPEPVNTDGIIEDVTMGDVVDILKETPTEPMNADGITDAFTVQDIANIEKK